MPHRSTKHAIACRPPRRIFDIRPVAAPQCVSALRRRVADLPGAAMLESIARHESFGRFSIYAWDPAEIIACEDGGHDPFELLTKACRPWRRLNIPPELPFVGGWIGYLSYEAGRFVEPAAFRSRRFSRKFPLAHWRLYDTAVVCDHLHDRWFAVGVELPRDPSRGDRPPLHERLDAAERFVADCTEEAGEAPMQTPPRASGWDDADATYLEKVSRILEYIRAGDIFQVNLARTLRAPARATAAALYERLCRMNPATHAAFLRVGGSEGSDAAILSSSPELFLHVRGRRVVTRPIKGTRPRGSDANSDRRAAAELTASEKDSAELNMIVDLERNDLGRVCEFGSVRVIDEGSVETLPTVFHRTATIAGTLRQDADAIDLLRATFPGGSITGAPKVRAMQIIEELEDSPRGPYCGAIGYISLNGDMQLNLPIRTMTVADGIAELKVGSGIVADSDPHEELKELEAKAAGMLAALGQDSEDRWSDSQPHGLKAVALHRTLAATRAASGAADD